MFKIGDFSMLSKVPVKTLRYYDQIDLLKPKQIDQESDTGITQPSSRLRLIGFFCTRN